MPPASAELRAKFPGSMEQALSELLAAGYREDAGDIKPPSADHQMTEREGDAIDYLTDEWDFTYQNEKAVALARRLFGDDAVR